MHARNARVSALLMLAVALPTLGCFQNLDRGAAQTPPTAAPASDDPATTFDTPEIELANGASTTDACVAVAAKATDILRTNCAGCHGGANPGARQGQPPFDCVLDFAKLVTVTSASVPDPHDPSKGMRFVLPGDPDDSRIYMRITHGEMPPTLPLGLTALPRPSVSDMSVLRTWIARCLGARPVGAGGTSGADGAAGAEGNRDAGALSGGDGAVDVEGTGGATGDSGGASMAADAGKSSDASPADAAGSAPGVDAGAPPVDARRPTLDAAVACGDPGQACCANDGCRGSACCTLGRCRANTGRGSCRTCGDIDQACCAPVGPSACAPGLTCRLVARTGYLCRP